MQNVDPMTPLVHPSRRNHSLKPLGTREIASSLTNQTPLAKDWRRPGLAVGNSSPTQAAKVGVVSDAATQKRVDFIAPESLAKKTDCSRNTKDPAQDGRDTRGIEKDKRYDQSAEERNETRPRVPVFHSCIGPTRYEDGNLVTKGSVDHRGITPHVVFTTPHTPPSVTKKEWSPPVTCGFCSSSNLTWILRCSFCGCARMSNAPRLKYLIDTILSIDPTIRPENLAKRILDYAKFDRVASKAEATFKQAALVRAKAAIMMMNRTVLTLRFRIMGMVFAAWKKAKTTSLREHALIHEVLTLKEAQKRQSGRQNVFLVWKGYVARVVDERLQRFQVALKRNESTKLRRIISSWRSFLYLRGKEKVENVQTQHEKELRDTPLEAQKEIYRLQGVQQDTINLIVTTGNTLVNLLHDALDKADHHVLKTLQFVQMYPFTAGEFFTAAHGNAILESLSSGQAMPSIEGFNLDCYKEDESIKQLLADTLEKVEKVAPSDSVIHWLNFQRRRGAEMSVHAPSESTNEDASRTGRRSRASSTIKGGKVRVKEKKPDIKSMKNLQDLRAVIANPGVMLKLLCHTSSRAQIEADRLKAADATNATASTAAETLTTPTTLSLSAHRHLRTYFKLAPRLLDLPPDLITRESFVLNDFDALYAYTVYLYLLHPNYVAPQSTLLPKYQIRATRLLIQWQKIQVAIRETAWTTLMQQQVEIFFTRVKRVHAQYLGFLDICKAVRQIVQCHERRVARDAWNDLSRRVVCKESNIWLALERESLAACIALSSAKLLAFCHDDDEVRQIEQVFKDHVLDLSKIFRLYGTGGAILEQDFLKIMTKAGVTSKRKILRSHLQIIYQQSRSGNPMDSYGFSSVESDDETEERGASPNEFSEALTRVAYLTYQKRREASPPMDPRGDESGTDVCTLLSSVVDLVDKLVPLTKKAQEQGLTFKKQLISPDVQHVCKAQEKKLKRIFAAYSQRNKNPQARGTILDVSDFEVFLKDRRLIDALFPHGKIKQLIAFVQQDGEAGTVYEGELDLVFSEFVEALAAIAVYRNANPYVAFAKKLDAFLDEYL